MKVNGVAYRSIWPIGQRSVGIIDQTRLPYELHTLELADWRAMVTAIASMQVRGAPLIGVAAAYGIALAANQDADEAGVPLHVWVDETRPRNQGLLTAWELGGHGVPHTLIADNAGGHLIQHGKVDIVLVGADRVGREGDLCNKIGTYLKALAARESSVPFYAAVPSPPIDWQLGDALREAPIEERAAPELRIVQGLDERGRRASVELASPASAVANPAFDVTPARF